MLSTIETFLESTPDILTGRFFSLLNLSQHDRAALKEKDSIPLDIINRAYVILGALNDAILDKLEGKNPPAEIIGLFRKGFLDRPAPELESLRQQIDALYSSLTPVLESTIAKVGPNPPQASIPSPVEISALETISEAAIGQTEPISGTLKLLPEQKTQESTKPFTLENSRKPIPKSAVELQRRLNNPETLKPDNANNDAIDRIKTQPSSAERRRAFLATAASELHKA